MEQLSDHHYLKIIQLVGVIFRSLTRKVAFAKGESYIRLSIEAPGVTGGRNPQHFYPLYLTVRPFIFASPLVVCNIETCFKIMLCFIYSHYETKC